MLKERGGIREDEGGTSIVEPLMSGTNTTVKSYRGYEIIDVTPIKSWGVQLVAV